MSRGPLFTTVTLTSDTRSSDRNATNLQLDLFCSAQHARATLSIWELKRPLHPTMQGYHPSGSIPCGTLRCAKTPQPPPSAFRCGNAPQFRVSYPVRSLSVKVRPAESSVHRDCKFGIRAARERPK